MIGYDFGRIGWCENLVSGKIAATWVRASNNEILIQKFTSLSQEG